MKAIVNSIDPAAPPKRRLRRRGDVPKRKTVFVSGHFNVLHPGHVRLLRFAKECGDHLTVAVESDRIAGVAAHVPEQLRLEGIAWLIGETEPRRGTMVRPLDKPEALGVDLAVELSR